MKCEHCGKPIFQPYSEGITWYHDDREGTLRCFNPRTRRWRNAKPKPAGVHRETGKEGEN